jgi:hypothetical protein
MVYLQAYLQSLGCKTLLIEHHYIDRDFICDLAAFYSRSLRDYPNYCRRLHFFASEFTLEKWQAMIDRAASGERREIERELDNSYLGYVVIRPLPGYPVGRTVLKTYGESTVDQQRREFGCTHDYEAHVGPFTLSVHGLAFQQQDQGVSACATTAIWSAMHGTASMEGASLPTPAEITQAASRYLLLTGRALPSGGLTTFQMCEAIRSAGFEPVLFDASDPSTDRAQLLAYQRSGFPPILCLIPVGGSANDGHAVCVTGVKLGQVELQTDPDLAFRDAASAVTGLYVHDDRLGPYAMADLAQSTNNGGRVQSVVRIRWPGDGAEIEEHWLSAVIVPMPQKVRLNVVRLREVGLVAADLIGHLMAKRFRSVILSSRYLKGVDYRQQAINFGLTQAGNYLMQCELVLSRYVGIIELADGPDAIVDILVDATETRANPSVIGTVVRSHSLDSNELSQMQVIADALGAQFIA